MKNLKNLSKKSLALLLTLVMCLGMINLTAFADDIGCPSYEKYGCHDLDENGKCYDCVYSESAPTEEPEVKCTHPSRKEVVTDATCTVDGYFKLVCDDCGEVLDEHVCPATGHEYQDGKCKYCGQCCEVDEDGDHKLDKRVIPATCTEPSYAELYCGTCGYSEKEEISDPLGHTCGDKAVNNEATCTEKGNVTYYCATCGAETGHDEIDSLGHTEVERVLNPATCTEKGNTETVCETCEAVLSSEEIPALGHDWGAWTAETDENGNSTDKGHYQVCGHCDSHGNTEGHRYGDWETVTEATTEAEGLEKRTCEDCGYEQTRPIEKVVAANPDPVVTTYPLTVNYVYEDGSVASTAYTASLAAGATYSVASPAIDGYTADQLIVSGAMQVGGATATVVYTAVEEDEIEDEEPPLAEIPDDDVPLADLPKEPEDLTEDDIDDEDVPLADVPKTGDQTNRFLVMAAVSGMCLLTLLSGRKEEDEA